MRFSCRTVLKAVGAFVRWTVAGVLLGLAGGTIFGLLTGILWVIFAADLARGVSNCWLFALAGAASGFILAVVAWWERPVPADPPAAVDRQTRIIVTRVTWDSNAASNGHSALEGRWTRPSEAPEPFFGETRGQEIE